MKRSDQIKQLRATTAAREEAVRKVVTADLEGPRRKEIAAFLAKMVREAKADPAIYRIDLMNFSSHEYYQVLCLDLEHNVVPWVPDIRVFKDDSLRLIQVSFLTVKAIEAFKTRLPLGSRGDEDTFEFIEQKRNRKTKRWTLVTKPILWEVE
jgi:hypothetical protein